MVTRVSCTNYYYFIVSVVVLSHGNEGILYGYDRPYLTHQLWEPFTADRCEDLAGKPKLFFIQVRQF